MTPTRRFLIGTTAGIALLAACYVAPARADLPVIDSAALGEWATALFNDAKAYALQLQQYATEVKTYIGDELSWLRQAQQYATHCNNTPTNSRCSYRSCTTPALARRWDL